MVDAAAENATKSAELQSCDLGGQRLRVAVSPQSPMVNCIQGVFGDWYCNGSNIEVINVLAQRFNFKADYIVMANHMPRKAKKFNNSYLATREDFGVVGLVANDRAIMSANGVMRTFERMYSGAVLISKPFDYFQLHFMLSKTIKDHDHIFLKPFSLQAWLAILGSAALIVPAFYAINSTSFHYIEQNDKELRKITLWQCIKYLARRHFRKVAQWIRPIPAVSSRTSSTASSSSSSNQKRKSSADSFDLVVQEFLSSGTSSVLRLEHLSQAKRQNEKFRKQQLKLTKQQWKLERKRARKHGRRSGFFNLPYVVWYVAGSLSNQGGETEDLPEANSTRILIAFWWLYLIVICAIHSGILTAILTFPKQRDFVQTMEDFIELGPSEMMRLIVDRNTELGHLLNYEQDLQKTDIELLLKHYKKVTGSPIVLEDFLRHRQRVLDEVQAGKAAFLEEKSTIDHIITQEYFDTKPPKCLFKSSRFPIDVIPMSFVLSPKLPKICIDEFNNLFRRIAKSGLARKWRRKYEAKGNDCLETVVINAGDVDKIELKHVILAFWLLMTGLFIGLFILIGEVVWLFTFADDEDDNDDEDELSTSSSDLASDSSSSSSSLEALKLGHRRANQLGDEFQPRPITSLQSNVAKASIKRIRKHQKIQDRLRNRRRMQVPTVTFMLEEGSDTQTTTGSKKSKNRILEVDPFDDSLVNSSELLDKASLAKKRAEEKRRRRLAKAAEKRARRVKRTLDLAKRLHDGRVYSHSMKSSMKRARQAVMRRLSLVPASRQERAQSSNQPVRERSVHPTSSEPPNLIRRRRRITGGQSRVVPIVTTTQF